MEMSIQLKVCSDFYVAVPSLWLTCWSYLGCNKTSGKVSKPVLHFEKMVVSLFANSLIAPPAICDTPVHASLDAEPRTGECLVAESGDWSRSTAPCTCWSWCYFSFFWCCKHMDSRLGVGLGSVLCMWMCLHLHVCVCNVHVRRICRQVYVPYKLTKIQPPCTIVILFVGLRWGCKFKEAAWELSQRKWRGKGDGRMENEDGSAKWKWKCSSRVQSGVACGVCMKINFQILI